MFIVWLTIHRNILGSLAAVATNSFRNKGENGNMKEFPHWKLLEALEFICLGLATDRIDPPHPFHEYAAVLPLLV